MVPAFASVDDVIERLRAHAYVCDRRIATAVFLADRMEKPILVEGPAGVGKTELAKTLAAALSAELIRLQCYEGLDEAKSLYEWEYPKQLLYTQILRDKIGEVTAGATSLADAVDKLAAQEDAFFSERFLLARPLLRAIRSPQRSVLLIDEVDRSDAEFEAFLLEVLSECLGQELIRLQCYEGLDEAKALYEWEYGKQLLYTQILKDKIGEVL
ncbi:MAG TPA: MoxR family ATPase, partial [Polyangia bacterium]